MTRTRHLMHVREIKNAQHMAELKAQMATLQAQQATAPGSLMETAVLIARMQERANTLREVLTGHAERREA